MASRKLDTTMLQQLQRAGLMGDYNARRELLKMRGYDELDIEIDLCDWAKNELRNHRMQQGEKASNSKPSKSKPNIDLNRFEGRTCSLIDAILWVARALGVKKVTHQDAPSAEAWSMYLRYCEKENTGDFWNKLFPKAVSAQKDRDDSGDDVFADQELLDIIDMIIENPDYDEEELIRFVTVDNNGQVVKPDKISQEIHLSEDSSPSQSRGDTDRQDSGKLFHKGPLS